MLYLNISEEGALIETFADERRIAPSRASNLLLRVEPKRAFRLIPLQISSVRSALRLDKRISTTPDYDLTRVWGKALHDACPEADGIRYVARKADPDNLALFLDRCASDLTVHQQGTLRSRRKDVLGWAVPHGIAVDFPP